jgi:hypothetical protein
MQNIFEKWHNKVVKIVNKVMFLKVEAVGNLQTDDCNVELGCMKWAPVFSPTERRMFLR